ncbi:MAG: hypothetical protein RIT04_350 [Candidatus Parcubacteria bacterium]|jgi:hypothetical protein
MFNRAEREAEMRKNYPAMFDDPELQEGEIWIGDEACEVLGFNVNMMRKQGLSTLRVGPNDRLHTPKGKDYQIRYRPIFANRDQYFALLEAHESKTALE